MFAAVIAIGLGFVLLGAALLWAALTMPHLLALGVNIATGLTTLLGGVIVLVFGLLLREARLARLTLRKASASDVRAAVAPLDEAPAPVVEEKRVRGRAVRVRADGSVEAALEQGWFRFDSLNHLHEYLDALERANIPPG